MMTLPRDTGDRDAPADDGASAHAHGSFFGRRKGHKLRIHQADLIDKLLPHLALDITAPAPERLADLFEGDIEDVRLEIGFGGGEHLIAEAQAFPKIGFIGCEPYVNGMAKILTQIETHNIGNIRLYAGDAAELLAWAPPRSLARIDLIHPEHRLPISGTTRSKRRISAISGFTPATPRSCWPGRRRNRWRGST